MAQPTRRIVTGHDAEGRSVFIADGDATNVNVSDKGSGTAVTELWSTEATPASNAGNEDAGNVSFRLEPTPGGTRFRVVEYPPDSIRFGPGDDAGRAARESRGGADVATDTARHPGMHRTASIDYAIVLSGEIYALMDEGETLMRPGDILVQRGTSHAWSNRTDTPARVAFVLVGAEPV